MIRSPLILALLLLLGAAGQDDRERAPIRVQRDAIADHRVSGETLLYVRAEIFVEQVSLEITVDESGTVTDVRLDPDNEGMAGPGGLPWLEPAIALARQWRFRPFLRDGRPVAARGRVMVGIVQAERLPTRHVPFPEVRREDVTIRLTRSGCFGDCPDYSITIAGDGSVRFAGRIVNVRGEHRYAIPVERVEALIRQFREADFWLLDDRYATMVSDSPTYTLTFSAGRFTKTVTDYVGNRSGMPRVVTALEEAVDAAADSERWTVGNGRTLAALEAEHFDFRSLRAAHLFEAVVQNGPETLAIALLDRGAPIDLPSNCPSCEGGHSVREQALFQSVRAGRLAVFDRLAADSTATLSPQMLDRLLMFAARARSPHLVGRLLARGARATATDRELGSALIQALSDAYGRVAPDADQGAVVRLLLDRGSPLEARDMIGWTALQHAYDEDPALARLLLARGAGVDAVDGGSQPILYLTDEEEIALVALEAGANRGLTDSEGRTLTQIASRNRWTRVERLLGRAP